jgi:hypothetical protein
LFLSGICHDNEKLANALLLHSLWWCCDMIWNDVIWHDMTWYFGWNILILFYFTKIHSWKKRREELINFSDDLWYHTKTQTCGSIIKVSYDI